MSSAAFLFHLLSFLAPAFSVALVVASTGRTLGKGPRPLAWWQSVVLDFLAGTLVLAAGLWHFGVDGKMATYAALVLVVASVEWANGRGWRR